MHHLILSVSPASVDHLQTSLLLPHQLVREVQYGIVCLFKDVPPELMDNNQLLRVSNHCKNFVQIRSIQSPTATIGWSIYQRRLHSYRLLVLRARTHEGIGSNPAQSRQSFDLSVVGSTLLIIFTKNGCLALQLFVDASLKCAEIPEKLLIDVKLLFS